MRIAPCYRRTTGTAPVLGRLLAVAALALMVSAAPASAAPPANDAFASPAPLSGATPSATGTNVEATLEPGEPIPADNFQDTTGEGSVWFSWTAPSSGTATIDLCATTGAGSIEDSELGVYTGTVLSELREAGSNDDTPGCGALGLLSKVTMPVTEGLEYRISVRSFSGVPTPSARGSFTLSIAQTPALANDNFASAYLIQTRFNEPDLATTNEGGGTTTGATVEGSEPTAAGNRTVWYSWVAERTRQVQITTCESAAIFTRVIVYTGSGTLASLVNVPGQQVHFCSNDTNLRGATFDAVQGTTYWIQVSNVGTAGAGALRVVLDVLEGRLAATPASLPFGDQPLSTVSASQLVTLENTGDGLADMGVVSTSGAHGSDFLVTADGCTGGFVSPGDSCTFRMRFAPEATGARTGTAVAASDAVNTPAVPMTGTGVAAPTTGPGPQGPGGANGTNGAPGPQGATGRQGPPGRNAVVTCKPRKARIKGKKVTIRCTVRFLSASRNTVRARLSRGGVTFASGSRVVRAGRASLRMRPRRPIRPGRYTLTLRFANGGTLKQRVLVR